MLGKLSFRNIESFLGEVIIAKAIEVNWKLLLSSIGSPEVPQVVMTGEIYGRESEKRQAESVSWNWKITTKIIGVSRLLENPALTIFISFLLWKQTAREPKK
jgi:hypothetical protein